MEHYSIKTDSVSIFSAPFCVASKASVYGVVFSLIDTISSRRIVTENYISGPRFVNDQYDASLSTWRSKPKLMYPTTDYLTPFFHERSVLSCREINLVTFRAQLLTKAHTRAELNKIELCVTSAFSVPLW
jgi:hypothetical protein